MGCGSCSSSKDGIPAGCNNNGSCATGCGNMLDVYDWLSNVYYVDDVVRHPLIEVRFKGTRKGFFRNVNNLVIEIGQKVVVETAMGGHDVGEVSLVGPLIKVQMKKYNIPENSSEIRKVYRVTTDNDLERWREAKAREYITQMKSREYARQLGLQMKISDVEFQGDNSKATFYYTADGRVDFRELIKIFAKNFRIKVEMRQIGLRQEAGRLGGIGSCGRELCCSTWLTDFNSVPTTAARYQNLFLNPLKLSGQCGRLKCCLNFELDTYMEALEEFPDENVVLHTTNGKARVVKTDILKGIMFFILEEDPTHKFMPVDVQDVKEMIEQQKAGKKVVFEEFEEYVIEEAPVADKQIAISGDIVADDLDRFDKRNKPKGKRRSPAKGRGKRPQSSNPREGEKGEARDSNTADRRPRADRPDNRNKGPRPESKPRSERQGDKPQTDKPRGERPAGGKPRGERPSKPRGERNDSRPQGERKERRPQGERKDARPEGERSQKPRPERQSRPKGEKRSGRPQNSGKPEGENKGGAEAKPDRSRNRNNRSRKPKNEGGAPPKESGNE